MYLIHTGNIAGGLWEALHLDRATAARILGKNGAEHDQQRVVAIHSW